MTDHASELLSVAETARLLRRSTEQVRRYLREGSLPGRRLGGQWFIHHADAEAFLRHRPDGSDFLRGLASSTQNPLSDVIAIGGSGGGRIADGRAAYFRGLARDAHRE
ncbi:MAG: helix-turn-helix domain-containing protein [Chloroflexia bacterium]|nr:helix-turn-helix domain-containing protein [Chloroflexia bacterium]